jgi:aldehyde dehydrogenase (NAD+)
MAELVLSHRDELAKLDALSMGRPVDGYFDADYAGVHFNYFGEAGYALGHTSLNTPGFLNMSLKQPFGVVGIIIPCECFLKSRWRDGPRDMVLMRLTGNAPLDFFSKKVAPAVAAGNTVVLKSSEKAPLTVSPKIPVLHAQSLTHYSSQSWRVSKWIEECGFPPGVINVLSGHGHISGNAMSLHMKIRAISFTGSTRTGRAIQIASANSNLKKVVFELGGKGPALVFEDAGLEQAARETEFSIDFNSGQTCMANSRIYVQESIAEKFLVEFKKLAGSRKMGDPSQKDINHGPQADNAQYENVLKYIEIGKESGGKLELGGDTQPTGAAESLTVHPVIFTGQPEDSRIMKEEVFGPVVVINTFETEEEAISKANDTEFGLYAALWTKDLDRALRVGKKLESGMVDVNCASPTGSWDLPFGGWKQSGTGRESLLESMDHFVENKSMYFKVPGIGG